MNRPGPSARIVLLPAIVAGLVLAPASATAGTRKADGRKSARQAPKPPPEPPEPDPLASAWPSPDAPQLGDGTRRSEIVVAARRLVGLANSFDEDAFVRHLAYVLDLARKRDAPGDTWVRNLVRRAIARGDLKKDGKVRPGDLVVFSLDPARPASAKASRLVVGVVESARKGTVRFIAPIGDTVQRGLARPGRKANPDDTAIVACRAAEPPKDAAPKAGAKKRSKKAAKALRALPCRAGEMWVGRISADTLDRLF